jgi:hypothetical protein
MGATKSSSKPKPTAKGATSARPSKRPSVKWSGVLKFGSKTKDPVKKGKPAASTKPAGKKGKKLTIPPPLSDEHVGDIPDLPSESEIEQQVGNLSTADKAAFTKIRRFLAEHLGSHAAARAWLTTSGGGFEGTPLNAIRSGMAEHVLKLLTAQWSRNPSYA